MTLATDLAATLRARLLVVLESYLDESFSDGSPRIFVVAGWLGTAEVWRALESDWRAALKRTRPRRLREFKASDCLNPGAGQGQFRGWGLQKRARLRDRLLEIINRHPIQGVFAVLVGGPLPKHAEYMTCISFCMAALTGLADSSPIGERVAFILDEREKIKGLVEEFRVRLRRAKTNPLAHRVGPATFDSSLEVLPLQAADLLAYLVFRMARDIEDSNHFDPGANPLTPLRGKIAEYRILRWDRHKHELRMLRQTVSSPAGRWIRLIRTARSRA